MAGPISANSQSISVIRDSGNEYREGALYFTPQVALYGFALNFGANLEYGLTDNIGLGGTIMFAFWSDNDFFGGRISQTLITPSAEAYYHFTQLDVDKLDLYTGAALGFSIYSFDWDIQGGDDGMGTSGLFLSPVLGGRYYITPKIAASLKLYVSILGDWAGVGGVIGVTIVLK